MKSKADRTHNPSATAIKKSKDFLYFIYSGVIIFLIIDYGVCACVLCPLCAHRRARSVARSLLKFKTPCPTAVWYLHFVCTHEFMSVYRLVVHGKSRIWHDFFWVMILVSSASLHRCTMDHCATFDWVCLFLCIDCPGPWALPINFFYYYFKIWMQNDICCRPF